MSHSLKWAVSLMLALGLGLGVQAAQAADPELEPCTGYEVDGLVVDVDEETGVVTIDPGDGGLCTVTVEARDYDHPIVALLGTYFSAVDFDDLAEALEASEIEVVCSAGGCELAGAGDEGSPVRVLTLTENADGSYTVTFLYGDETTPRTLTLEPGDDDEVAGLIDDLEDALDARAVVWDLEDGAMVDAGEAIQELHEDGLGFGVIVKLYAMAAESQEACAEAAGAAADPAADEDACAVSVQDLADEFQSGVGLGQLFKEYGKPSMLGVGHVRKALKQEASAAELEDGDDLDDDEADDESDASEAKCPANPNSRKPGCETELEETVITADAKNTGKPDKNTGKPARPTNPGNGKPDKNTGKPGKP